jgi:hypothetical protein
MSRLTEPRPFARFCALIGYAESDVVCTLVTERGMAEEDARRIVDEVYSEYAREEAGVAARAFESGDPETYLNSGNEPPEQEEQ